MLVSTDRVQAVISTSRGHVELVSARPLPPIHGWRAMFDLVPEGTQPIDLRMYLSLDGQALSETWMYQYKPPPLAVQRRYLSS